MIKLARLFLTLALLVSSAAALHAQMRPRRVEQSEPTTTRTNAPANPARRDPRSEQPRASKSEQQPRANTQDNRGEVSEEVGEDEVVRVNASLVTVPVSVLDRDGRFIGGLSKEDFRIFEDGAEQEVAYFAPVEQPFTVALVIDTSGSTRFKLEDIQDAAIAFLDQLRSDDRVIVVSFDDDIRVLSDATSDRNTLRRAIRQTRTGEGTRLYDAVDLVIRQQLSRARGRKAIVLFTDGVDTTSKQASYQSTLAEAEELDAMIYPVQYDTFDSQAGGGGGGWPGRNPYPSKQKGGLGDIISIIIGGGGSGGGGGGAGTSRADYERAGEYLHQLAAETGGRHHNADDLRNIEEAFTNIAEELRRQYSLGYYPKRQSQAQERRLIKVRVKRPNLVVRARDGYVYKPEGGGTPADNTAQDTNARRPAPELRGRHFNGTRRSER
jgi:VWFA-related protein